MIKISILERSAGYAKLGISNFSPAEREKFRQLALAHLVGLDHREFEMAREHAARSPSSIARETFSESDGFPQLTQKIFESEILLGDLNHYQCRMEHVGAGQGGPVMYVRGAGVFIYSPPDRQTSLMIWLSHPAYPKGW